MKMNNSNFRQTKKRFQVNFDPFLLKIVYIQKVTKNFYILKLFPRLKVKEKELGTLKKIDKCWSNKIYLIMKLNGLFLACVWLSHTFECTLVTIYITNHHLKGVESLKCDKLFFLNDGNKFAGWEVSRTLVNW